MGISRQGHSNMRWKSSIVGILGLIAICRSAPTSMRSPSPTGSSRLPAVSTAPPPRRSPDQEVGSPSELAWQAWLLVDAQTGAQSEQDSASLARRITPKSVFIAPAFEACAEGYTADSMGRCTKDTVTIDREAHFAFLLQRLNAVYANGGYPGRNDEKPQSSAATGPLQLNIPLGISGSQMAKPGQEETEDSMEVAVVVPPQGGAGDNFKEKKEAIVTVYEINNDTKSERNTFFLGNTTRGNHSSSLSDVVVPVAEFIDDGNQTFSDVVDYRIPVGMKSLFNESDMRVDESVVSKNGTKSNFTGSVSPTIVLLLSPTKLPLAASTPDVDELEFAHNSTAGHILVRTENVTDNSTEKEIISVSVPTSAGQSMKIPPTPAAREESKNESDNRRGAVPQGERLHKPDENFESTGRNNTDEVKILFPEEEEEAEEEEEEEDDDEDEEYVGSVEALETTVSPDEYSTEVDDEILKHGEAGISIPSGNAHRVHLNGHQDNRETILLSDLKYPATHPVEDLPPLRLNRPSNLQSGLDAIKSISRKNSTQFGNDNAANEETTSNVSSEVSIHGDVIFETTLLDLNTDKAPNVYTVAPVRSANFSDVAGRDEFRELFEAEREVVSEPEVVFSPHDGHGVAATNVHGKKRAEEIRRPEHRTPGRVREENRMPSFADLRLHENVPYLAQSYSGSVAYDPHPDDDPMPEIHTIDEQASFNRERIAMPDRKPTNFYGPTETDRPNGFRPTGGGYKSSQDFVRFPDERPVPSRIRSHIRFPSEEANSIQAQNYKDRPSYPEDGSHSSTSTKSSVPIHQKQSYWWMPSNWRVDQQNQQQQQQQQQQQPIQQPSQQSQRKQRPMLLRFWTRMPLITDPSLYRSSSPTQNSPDDAVRGPHQLSQQHSPISPHHMNFYKEMSAQDVNRVFAQKLRAPIGG